MAKKKEHTWIWRLIIGVVICVVLYQFKDVILDGLREMKEISLPKIIIIIGLSLAFIGIEGSIIFFMVRQQKHELSLKEGIKCAYYCAFVRLATLGGGAGVGEIYYLSRQGVNPGKATGISLIQYMMQKITVALYGGVSFLLFYSVINTYLRPYNKYIVIAVIITLLVVAGIIFITVPSKCSAFIIKNLDKIGSGRGKWQERIQKLKEQIQCLQDAATSLFQEKKTLGIVFFLNFAKYTCWYMIPFVLYGSDTNLTLCKSLIFTALVTMLTGVIPAPSGLGALETVFIILFSPIIEKSRGVSLALVYRLCTTLVPFIIGSVVAWQFNKKNSNEKITI